MADLVVALARTSGLRDFFFGASGLASGRASVRLKKKIYGTSSRVETNRRFFRRLRRDQRHARVT